jgi:hypothetical protein
MRATLLTLACLLAGCAAVPTDLAPAGSSSFGVQDVPPPAAPGAAHDWETKSVLYARDGTPIPASGPGASSSTSSGERVDESPAQRLATDESGGRMYILELYQKVIEERDSYATEIQVLSGEIERMRGTLLEADRRIAELEEVQSSMNVEKQALIDENLDLAARLTTAQIRRLQAEKILLEKELDDLREGATDAPPQGEETSQP